MSLRSKYLGGTSALVVASLILGGCAEIGDELDPTRDEGGVVVTQDDSRSPRELAGAQSSMTAARSGEGTTRVELVRPREPRLPTDAEAQAPAVAVSEEPVTVNFVDADIREVARTVLGEIFQLPYSIDPTVQGRVTFETSAPIPKSKFLATFETVLRVNGFALIRQGDIYTIVPLGEASSRVRGLDVLNGEMQGGIGFRQVIVPLRYVSAQDLRTILEPLSPQGGIVLTDNTRNLIVLSGARSDIESMLEVIRTFDTDWMASMSFAIVTPANVDAVTLARELGVVFDNPKNPGKDVVDLIPMQRLNAVLVIANDPGILQEVSSWARRLDRRAMGGGRQIYYYRVQNAKASKLLESLGPVLGFETPPPVEAAVMEAAAAPAEAAAEGGPPQPQLISSANEEQQATSIGPKVSADEHNNALVILATAQEYALLEDALRQMDTAPLQVLIEATIAEVTLNDRLQYGVQWFFESGNETFTLSDDETGDLVAKFPGFSFASIAGSSQIVLNALSNVTDVNVVSSPRIMALTNQPAMIQVGDQVPIITQTAVSVQDPSAPIVNTVEMRDTGVILRVTPRINNSGLVTLDVEQEVSDVIETTTSDLDSPTIQQRKVKSTVAVRNGDTAVLGGLIRNSVSDGRSGVPFLKDIPVVGELFSSTSNSRRRTELLIFLKPRVVTSPADSRQVVDELTREVQSLVIRKPPKPIRKRF